MDHRDIPKPVHDRLLALNAQFEHLTEKARRIDLAIRTARERLSGKFHTDAEYNTVNDTLKKLVKDLPVIESKRDAADEMIAKCQAWLEKLPDDVDLEIVKPKSNGADLNGIRQQLRHAQDELETLAKVPTPSSDIEQRVKDYVTSRGRPKVSGVDDGKLEVRWPSDDAVALLAILQPDQMVAVILAEVERAANDPLPLPQRKQRMAELRRMIDTAQRQAFALGENTYPLPPQVILGVKVVRREPAKRIERRVSAA